MEEKGQAGTRRFTYNSRHQQTRVETETGNIQENRYDAEGLRYELLENGRSTRFVYHNGELLHEKGGETERSREEKSYHLGIGIEAFHTGQKTVYFHKDEQLSTSLILDENGDLKNQYQYDAFGAGLEALEEFSNRIRYTGQQYDQFTGQYYLRVRYYNPVFGRFMQEDVYQGDGLNLYAYCKNNPVIYYDPSGYACDDPEEFAGDGGEGGIAPVGTVSKINPFELQPTHSQMLSNRNLNLLIDKIRMNGITETIKYVEFNGQKYIVDGHHRQLAAKRLGLTEVPIEKVDLPYGGYKTIDDLLWF